MAHLINISENGTCDDCGRKLRYVYHTDDGRCYGSECVRKYIQAPKWLSCNAKADSGVFARINIKAQKVIERIIDSKPSEILFIPKASLIRGIKDKYGLNTTYTDKDRIAKFAAPKIIDTLLGMGWEMEKGKCPYDGIEKFCLTRSDQHDIF